MSKDTIIEELWETKDVLSEEVGKDFENLDALMESIRTLPDIGPEVQPKEFKAV